MLRDLGADPVAPVGKHLLSMKPRIIVATTKLPDGRSLELHEHDGTPCLYVCLGSELKRLLLRQSQRLWPFLKRHAKTLMSRW